MVKLVRAAVCAVTLSALLPACKGDEAPSCDEVKDHTDSLYKDVRDSSDNRPAIMKAMRILNRCDRGLLSADQRRCIVKAGSLDEFDKCDRSDPDDTQPKPE